MRRPATLRSCIALVVAAAAGCAVLPKHIVRPFSSALPAPRDAALAPLAEAHAPDSGFVLLNTGERALQARVALCDVAQSSIDAQYYELAGDSVGRAVLDRVIAAADRGVRVRLLLDDYTSAGHDIAFQALDAHPNIEVRIFNPFVRGRLRLPQLLHRFTELNHRMHNKMLIVDGQAAVVGGRNLTDDYFGLGRELDFRDFDLLAVGTVVPAAAAAFDRYWNSAWSYPISALRKAASFAELQRQRARFERRLAADGRDFPYVLPRGREQALAWLDPLRDQLIWAPAEVVYDDPRKMARPVHGQITAVGRRLGELAAATRQEIVAENAYLVPHEDLAMVRAALGRGVRLSLLTNSLATTDVLLVNAAYAKSRPALAELGVSLYEMKPRADSRALYLARPARSPAHLALHGKAAVFDREVVFLGSFNLDPRSMYLDTEAVFVVHSPALSAQLLDAFATDFAPANAWHIGPVVGKKDVAWLAEHPQRIDVEPHDPASLWRRMLRSLARLLPVRAYL